MLEEFGADSGTICNRKTGGTLLTNVNGGFIVFNWWIWKLFVWSNGEWSCSVSCNIGRNNFFFWRFQVLPAVRAHNLEGFLTGARLRPEEFIPVQAGGGSIGFGSDLVFGPSIAVPQIQYRLNRKYLYCMRTDQALKVWMLALISESMLGHVIRCTSSQQIWLTLEQ